MSGGGERRRRSAAEFHRMRDSAMNLSGVRVLLIRRGQQSHAAVGSRWATAVGNEAEVADTNKAARKQMEQEATEELVCVQAHQLPLVAVCRVAPTEVDVVIVQCNESVVGDRDAMSVGAEIAQHVLGTSEGTLGVDDPVVTEEGSHPCWEAALISQMQ